MIVAEIIARLATAPDTPFALVEGTAALVAIKDAPPEQLPAAYVFRKANLAGENETGTEQVIQRVGLDVAVLIITENLTDPAGAAAAADVESLDHHVVARLLGWKPPSATEVIELVGGELVRIVGGIVWWETTVATAYHVRSV